MKQFSVKEKFETEIREIWDNDNFRNFEVIKRGFGIQDIILKESIMFIGINPSYDVRKDKPSQEFYSISQSGESHPYFNKFKIIADNQNHHWTHFDLLFFRETNQRYVNELLKSPNGVEFIYRQLEISKKVLIEAKPKVLIISNTMARHFMGFDKNQDQTQGVWMGFDFVFDDKFGTHKLVNNSDLDSTPVFFTSMLTGQRALDKGSFERLNWHINFVLKQLK